MLTRHGLLPAVKVYFLDLLPIITGPRGSGLIGLEVLHYFCFTHSYLEDLYWSQTSNRNEKKDVEEIEE